MISLTRKRNTKFTQIPWIFHVYGSKFIIFIMILLPYTSAQSPPRQTPPPPQLLDQNFRPSMLVVIVVLIVAFFFMGFFSIYIRQCVGQNSPGDTTRAVNGNGIGRSRRAKRGLDPSVIDTFPTFIYSVVKGLKIGKGALECAVCLNEFEDDETCRLLPKCDHVFHPECIDAWLVSHTTCPVCRCDLKEITPTDDANDVEQRRVHTTHDDSDSDTDSDTERRRGSDELINESQEQVLIRVTDGSSSSSVTTDSATSAPDLINPSQTAMQNRPARSKSFKPKKPKKILGKFPRSHSTGHSLIQPGENVERFTLRLPDEVMKQIVNGKLNRTTSLMSFTKRQSSISGGSSHRGGGVFRGGSVNAGSKFYQFAQLSKSDRWSSFKLSMPSFFTRAPSIRLGSKVDRPVDLSSSGRPPV
ncbi:hypothetical protein C5167_042122 [Papaver somniferum]|uniref:E3 ubiquitin-protein ligase ATL31-like n=1 Tax=Papaver somniferum TaxID=3469 RepID=UPI000E6F8407|nr:E3 ubiquitin-protein ligase ATL31-like [Papaver somniferum]RZC87191.1 hypothetical protein C5167_042122 [Papaver somniferum]